MEGGIREALSANNLTVEDIDVFVPHQANIRILKAVSQRLGLPFSKTVINLDRYGNTSAASIPLALDEAVKDGRIQRGDIVLFAAFGAGLTWASGVMRW
jgi:3-oxoacyl-[acyl-carrier-protein] synthase-3